ncbi:hypothetical protein [Chryseobacterium kwangjuense]|uniref:Phage tail collar domain-containing protein n=1 Tax=Chryseobacterium kwangjuense TaxID=267125 RepID=A0A135W2F7_9FLAO|nr:hypothetical protein [Chryseobacterium kwangjuense]KXH79093.1 hypothetical protein AU378_20780 [Chryseobacterium kwangjuense]
MKNNLLLIAVCLSGILKTQVGIGTANPNSNAALELSSASKGLLLPRLSLSDTASPTPLANHEKGIVVYNISTVNDVVEGIYINDGTRWYRLYTNQPNIGDVYYSFVAADHQGWYKLDGRNLTTLPAGAQANASKLAIGSTLPNATDRYLKQRGAAALLSAGGAQTVTLTQANLPNLTYTGTTTAAGEHTHQYTDRGNGTFDHKTGAGQLANTTVLTGQLTSSSGAHTHTVNVPSGGSGTPITIEPKNIAANAFIYLGY